MILNVTPMGAPRMTQRDVWKERPVVVRYFAYKDALREALPGYELPVELTINFFIPFPKSYTKKQREQLLGKPHDQKPDIDNLAKAFMDAFHSEDKRVAGLHACKYWAETGAVELPEIENLVPLPPISNPNYIGVAIPGFTKHGGILF